MSQYLKSLQLDIAAGPYVKGLNSTVCLALPDGSITSNQHYRAAVRGCMATDSGPDVPRLSSAGQTPLASRLCLCSASAVMVHSSTISAARLCST